MISYNSAISASEKAGEWQVAMQLMEELMAHQLLPDLITYNAVTLANFGEPCCANFNFTGCWDTLRLFYLDD